MEKGRAALLALVLQNTLLVLTMRYSRTRPGPMYLASSAVIVDEVRPTIARRPRCRASMTCCTASASSVTLLCCLSPTTACTQGQRLCGSTSLAISRAEKRGYST